MSVLRQQPLAWGILSTAAIVDDLLPGFAAANQADLLAVASRAGDRAAAFAQARGIPTSHGSYEELLADERIECVYVPVPNSLHAEWTRAALGAGKHVLCEKPLTASADEARELFELAEKRGLVLMEAFMYRHHPKTKRLRELIRQGRIGEPRVARMCFHFKVEDPAADIRCRPELAGGALRDVGCYCVSLCNYLADAAPLRLTGVSRISSSGVEDFFAATLDYGDFLATFDCGIDSPLTYGVEVLGTEGRAIVECPWYPHLDPLEVTLVGARGASAEATPGPNAYQLEIENFCAAVRGEAALEVSAAETLRNLETIDRLHAVAATPEVAA